MSNMREKLSSFTIYAGQWLARPILRADKLAVQKLKARKFKISRPVNMQRHWMNGDPVATAFYNNLSVSFPHAEIFMIESLKSWREHISDKLRNDVDAFMEQELNHSREHVAFNRGMDGAGFDVSLIEKKINTLVKKLNDRDDMFKLQMTVCMEHLTAIISSELLTNPHHLEGAEEELKKMWLWHATEEIEHKAVAFNVMQEATKNWSALRRWAVRSLLFSAMTYRFVVNRLIGQVYLLKQDGYSGVGAFMALMRYGLGKNADGKKGLMRSLIGPWAQFYKPNFHPWKIDDSHLIAVGESQFIMDVHPVLDQAVKDKKASKNIGLKNNIIDNDKNSHSIAA